MYGCIKEMRLWYELAYTAKEAVDELNFTFNRNEMSKFSAISAILMAKRRSNTVKRNVVDDYCAITRGRYIETCSCVGVKLDQEMK